MYPYTTIERINVISPNIIEQNAFNYGRGSETKLRRVQLGPKLSENGDSKAIVEEVTPSIDNPRIRDSVTVV